jgi:hypothetical protein
MLMHQYGRLDALYRRAVAVFTRAAEEDPTLAAHCRERLATYARVHEVATAYGRLLRAETLGLARETYSPEEAQAIYGRYAEMIHWSNAERLSREEFLRRIPSSRYSPAP